MTLTRLRNFWIWLNWLVVIMLSSPTALWTHFKMPARRTLSLVPPSAKSLPQWQCILDYFGISFISFMYSKRWRQRMGFCTCFAKAPDQIGPETAISASKTCDMSLKSPIPHWYLLRFCSVQIESLTVRLFTLKFLCAMRYQYAFTFLKPPHVIDLQTPRYRCPSKRQLVRSALLWIPKCINVTLPRFPSTRTWQRREEINYKMKHPRFWDDDNNLNGGRRL